MVLEEGEISPASGIWGLVLIQLIRQQKTKLATQGLRPASLSYQGTRLSHRPRQGGFEVHVESQGPGELA
jgi:hypothetical protein